jgi:UDP-N-acetylmuramoylalanine--D-glutamate ligase
LKLGVSSEICGNIGKPFLDFLHKAPQTEIWVAELSSYQTADLASFPKITVLLNLFPEHFDWHGSLDIYYRDKLRMFEPHKDKFTILNFSDPQSRQLTSGWENITYFNSQATIHVRGTTIYHGNQALGPVTTGDLVGSHNHSNVCAALTALDAAGFDARTCLEELYDFRGLPHRQKVVGHKNGLTFVDDSISTTPETAMAAIERFNDHPLCLLLGGYDRNQDYRALATLICSRNVRLVITLPDNGGRIATAIKAAIDRLGAGPELYAATDLPTAVKKAITGTPHGGIVLLSPAAASYGTYKDFHERGNAFIKLAGVLAT